MQGFVQYTQFNVPAGFSEQLQCEICPSHGVRELSPAPNGVFDRVGPEGVTQGKLVLSRPLNQVPIICNKEKLLDSNFSTFHVTVNKIFISL